MRAAAVCLAVGVAGALWFYAMGPLLLISPRFTVFQAMFLGTLSVAAWFAVRSGDGRAIRVVAILCLAWVAHQFVHANPSPLSLHGMINVAVGTVVLIGARERWEAIVAILFVGIVVAGAAAHYGIISGIANRPRGAFVAWSYPDIAAILGHLANVVVGGAADARGLADHRRGWLRGHFRPAMAFAVARRRH